MNKEEYEEHQDNLKEQVKKVQKVRDFIARNKPDLTINRGIGTSIDDFKKWAKEEFEDDWGFAFKFLWEMSFPNGLYIEERLNNLESKVESKPERVIKTLTGKIIGRSVKKDEKGE